MLRRIFLICATLLCCAAFALSGAATKTVHDELKVSHSLPFEPDEQLVYEGEFSKLLLRGIQIAEFRFSASRIKPATNMATQSAGDSATTQLIFKGDATAKGWFRKLFGVDFHFNMESLVEPETFTVLRTTKVDEQGKRVRTSEAVFDRIANRVTWMERNPNDPNSTPRIVNSPLEGAEHDFLSTIYFLRTQPLTPGQSFELVMSDSGHVYHLPVKVVERKEMKSVLGKAKALRVDIELFGEKRLIEGKGQMSLWLTDDARRVPIRARLNNDMGTLDITLKSITGGLASTK